MDLFTGAGIAIIIIAILVVALVIAGFIYASKLSQTGASDGTKTIGWVSAIAGLFFGFPSIIPIVLYHSNKPKPTE